MRPSSCPRRLVQIHAYRKRVSADEIRESAAPCRSAKLSVPELMCGPINVYASASLHDGSPMTHGRFMICCRLVSKFTDRSTGSAEAVRGTSPAVTGGPPWRVAICTARTFDFSFHHSLCAKYRCRVRTGASLGVPSTPRRGRIPGQIVELMTSARIPPEAGQGNGRAIVGEKCGDDADKYGNCQDWQSSR